MSTVPVPLPLRAAYTTGQVYRFTIEQWHEMIAQGTLTAHDPVELIEGVPVFKTPTNPPHETTTGLVSDLLTPLLPPGWHLRMQASITLADGEPEPDGAITHGRRLDYADLHPGPADVGVLIEVSHSTPDRDRGPKLRSFARAGVACYLVVNLVDRLLKRFADPDAAAAVPRYQTVDVFRPGDVISLPLGGGVVVSFAAADVLSPG